jgi:hypothetical protein
MSDNSIRMSGALHRGGLRSLLVAGWLAAWLCACDSSSSGGSSAPGSSAGARAGSSASATGAASVAVSGDPVDACIEVLRAESKALGPQSDGRMARGCAALYKQAVCREAHETYEAAEPTKRAPTLTQRCAAAYCGLLAEPKPRLCGSGDLPAQELGFRWLELRAAIWRLDLGEAQATRLEKEHLRLGAQRRPTEGK